MAREGESPEAIAEWIGTEEEWLSSRDQEDLLRRLFWLVDQKRISTSERKWMLFEVACLQRIRHVFQDERSRAVVDAGEQYADGLITHEELFRLGSQAMNPPNPDNLSEVSKEACSADKLRLSYAWDALAAAGPQAHGTYHENDYQEGATNVVWSTAQAMAQPEAEEQVLAELLRDIFGNPFRPVAVRTDWLAWNGGTVSQVAQGIYQERAFERLPILADAMDEAGCSDTEILQHCRRPGLHVRGCWLVDLILGKE